MIHYVNENLFDKEADILVNTVNCVGVMGKGIALEFKNRMPKMFMEYKEVCKRKELKPGDIWLYQNNSQIIINMATKNHWRNPSEYSWIEKCLADTKDYLLSNIRTNEIRMPIPGCGNGGLDPNIVSLMIDDIFSTIKNNVYVCVYK